RRRPGPGDQRRRGDPGGGAQGRVGGLSPMRPQFEPAQQALTLYFRALSGRACELSPYADDADLWQHPDTATTVRLPATAPPVDRWYDVALTHRALHHAMGTFRLDLDRPEPLFRRIRP